MLPEHTRILRIAELLSKGIALMNAPAPVAKYAEPEKQKVVPVIHDPELSEIITDEEMDIVLLIEKIGTITPKLVQERCEMSKTTTQRKLSMLCARGILQKRGNTRSVKYHIGIQYAGLIRQLKATDPIETSCKGDSHGTSTR